MKQKFLTRCAAVIVALSCSVSSFSQVENENTSSASAFPRMYEGVVFGYSPMTLSGGGESSTIGTGFGLKVPFGFLIKNKVLLTISPLFNFAADIKDHVTYTYYRGGGDFDAGYPVILTKDLFLIPTLGLGLTANFGRYSYSSGSETHSGSIDGIKGFGLSCNIGVNLKWNELMVQVMYTHGLTDFAERTKRSSWFFGIGYVKDL